MPSIKRSKTFALHAVIEKATDTGSPIVKIKTAHILFNPVLGNAIFLFFFIEFKQFRIIMNVADDLIFL